MIRVLLLDDEPLALEYLETLVDWEANGFTVTGRYLDANQALKACRREMPDLIISDVRMAGMDGVSFAEAVRGIDRETHILFLSGYREFDYVQRAIRLGIDDYLLKSDLNSEAFLAKLVRIAGEIRLERQKTKYTERSVFLELFSRGTEEQLFRPMMNEQEFLRIHRRYWFVLVSLRSCPEIMVRFLPSLAERRYADEAAVAEKIRAALDGKGSSVEVFRLDDNRLLVRLEDGEESVSRKESRDSAARAARRIFDALNDGDEGYDVFCGDDRRTAREAGKTYREAAPLLDCVYLYPGPRIHELREIVNAGRQAPQPGITADALYKALAEGNRETLDEAVRQLRLAVAEENAAAFPALLQVFLEALARAGKEQAGSPDGLLFSLAEDADRYDFRDSGKILEFIGAKLQEARALYAKGQTSYSRNIRAAVEYLRAHMDQEDLSGGMVAKAVGLSPSWLSAKFKEEVGMGITEYLNNIRIQKARELLQDSDAMIYEISEQCGFASSQYFSTMFKQLTGKTPNEFRRSRKK